LKALKENGIRFQTPYPAKMQVFLENGPVTYQHADEAAEDLKSRGSPVEYTARRKVTSPVERLSRLSHGSLLTSRVMEKEGNHLGERTFTSEGDSGISNGKM
jgi:hypothetical protein